MDTPLQNRIYPMLPLRDIVVFPHMIVPLFVGREKSVRALDAAMMKDRKIVLMTQKDSAVDDPTPADMHGVGTLGSVVQLLRLPDGTVKALVEGLERVKIKEYVENSSFFEVDVDSVAEKADKTAEIEAFSHSLVAQFEEYVRLNKKIPPEILLSVGQVDDASKLADIIASHLTLKIADRQDLLETADVYKRLEKLFALMEARWGNSC